MTRTDRRVACGTRLLLGRQFRASLSVSRSTSWCRTRFALRLCRRGRVSQGRRPVVRVDFVPGSATRSTTWPAVPTISALPRRRTVIEFAAKKYDMAPKVVLFVQMARSNDCARREGRHRRAARPRGAYAGLWLDTMLARACFQPRAHGRHRRRGGPGGSLTSSCDGMFAQGKLDAIIAFAVPCSTCAPWVSIQPRSSSTTPITSLDFYGNAHDCLTPILASIRERCTGAVEVSAKAWHNASCAIRSSSSTRVGQARRPRPAGSRSRTARVHHRSGRFALRTANGIGALNFERLDDQARFIRSR